MSAIHYHTDCMCTYIWWSTRKIGTTRPMTCATTLPLTWQKLCQRKTKLLKKATNVNNLIWYHMPKHAPCSTYKRQTKLQERLRMCVYFVLEGEMLGFLFRKFAATLSSVYFHSTAMMPCLRGFSETKWVLSYALHLTFSVANALHKGLDP